MILESKYADFGGHNRRRKIKCIGSHGSGYAVERGRVV